MQSTMYNLKELILTEIKSYQNKSYSELIEELKLPYTEKLPKSIGYLISKTIIKRMEEDKNISFNNFYIKTVRLNHKDTPLESISLSQINYNDIVNEDWSNSYLNKVLKSEFLFFVFKYLKKGDSEPIFISIKFWKMNIEDLDLAYKFWALTKDNIQRGDYDNFISIKNNFICHVRTKGLNSKDLIMTPHGTYQKKRSFWLNASYIKAQI